MLILSGSIFSIGWSIGQDVEPIPRDAVDALDRGIGVVANAPTSNLQERASMVA
jgi:hypothetical protein